MIDPRANDFLLFVTASTVMLGMIVLLFGLLVPRAIAGVAYNLSGYSGAGASLAQMIAAGSAISEATATLEAPPEPVKPATFAAIVAEAKRQVGDGDGAPVSEPLVQSDSTASAVASHDEQRDAIRSEGMTESGFDIDEMLQAPLVANLPEQDRRESTPVDRSALSKRITWPSLVDDEAIDCDLPTRLRLIEGLSFIGGNWSIDILARAYEQELDANVRGAIFVALRDARSAA